MVISKVESARSTREEASVVGRRGGVKEGDSRELEIFALSTAGLRNERG